MRYWIAAFAAALVVVIGYAAGPIGAIIAIIAFSIALFLLWAHRLGFNGAWTSFGLDRFSAPLLKTENWDLFNAIFADREKVVKAATVSVVLIAVSLILPTSQVIIAVVAVAAWYVFQVYRANKPARPAASTRRCIRRSEAQRNLQHQLIAAPIFDEGRRGNLAALFASGSSFGRARPASASRGGPRSLALWMCPEAGGPSHSPFIRRNAHSRSRRRLLGASEPVWSGKAQALQDNGRRVRPWRSHHSTRLSKLGGRASSAKRACSSAPQSQRRFVA